MTVLDAYALTAVLAGEPAATDVEPLLLTKQACIASPNLAEVFDKLIRDRGLARADVDQRVDTLIRTSALAIIALDDATSRRAGELRAGHYRRGERSVSLADCVAAATAESLHDELATADPHLVAMARELGIGVVALPNSGGVRP